MADILQRLTVARTYLELKFNITPQVSTLINEHFTLDKIADEEGEPLDPEQSISNPFKPIVLADHYNSLSRTLVLFFTELPDLGEYRLTIDGIRNASGHTLNEDSYTFEYTFDTPDTDAPVPDDSPVHVKDFSIKNAFITSETIFAANPDFFIAETDPENHTIFLEPDYSKGQITVRFSERPALSFMNDRYIKVQRKSMEEIVSRWEKVDAKFKLGASPSKNLYIRFPSVPQEDEIPDKWDETLVYEVGDRVEWNAAYYEANKTTTIGEEPDGVGSDDWDVVSLIEYNQEDKVYFEDGYKYRVRFSSEISSA